MEIREAIIGVISSAVTAVLAWILGKRKENADISTIQLENSQNP